MGATRHTAAPTAIDQDIEYGLKSAAPAIWIRDSTPAWVPATKLHAKTTINGEDQEQWWKVDNIKVRDSVNQWVLVHNMWDVDDLSELERGSYVGLAGYVDDRVSGVRRGELLSKGSITPKGGFHLSHVAANLDIDYDVDHPSGQGDGIVWQNVYIGIGTDDKKRDDSVKANWLKSVSYIGVDGVTYNLPGEDFKFDDSAEANGQYFWLYNMYSVPFVTDVGYDTPPHWWKVFYDDDGDKTWVNIKWNVETESAIPS